MGFDDLPQGSFIGRTIECTLRTERRQFTIQDGDSSAEFRITLTADDGDTEWVLTQPHDNAYKLTEQGGKRRTFTLSERDITIH